MDEAALEPGGVPEPEFLAEAVVEPEPESVVEAIGASPEPESLIVEARPATVVTTAAEAELDHEPELVANLKADLVVDSEPVSVVEAIGEPEPEPVSDEAEACRDGGGGGAGPGP